MFKTENLNSEFMKFGPVSFSVQPGEITGIEGESGSGKSVLLKALADIIVHDGEVYLNDLEQKDLKAHEWRKKVSLLPAEVLFWNKKIKYDLKNTEPSLLKRLGFAPEEVLGKRPDELSSGERQRLGLLRLLENKPEVLLLDEPCANLDENNKKIIENLIFDYLDKNRACVLWVGHDIRQLQRVSTKIYKISNSLFTEK